MPSSSKSSNRGERQNHAQHDRSPESPPQAVTCPYCGTSYITFQPNCSNCGAALPPPESFPATPPKRKRDLVFPPKPPREIARTYIWKLLGSDGWWITAMIFFFMGLTFAIVGGGLTLGVITAFVGLPFLGLGLIFFGGGVYVGYKRFLHFDQRVSVLKNGLATQGEILDVTVNHSVAINGRNPWKVRYIYSLDGSDYDGEITTLTPPRHLAEGQPTVVLYLQDKPAISSLYPHP